MRVTIEQIAERAGASPGTVSRVLNRRIKENRPAIARRAERIRDIAREMGYRPNLAARSIKSGRFGQVALVTCGDLGFDWFAPSLLHGIHSGLTDIDSRLIVNELAASEFDDPDQLPRLFREAAVDGMLINLDAKLSPRVVDLFDDQPVPAVLLNARRNTRSVYPAEFAGGRLAARHLIGLGFDRIGFFMLGDSAWMPHYSRRDRAEGVAAELDDSGLDPRRRLVGTHHFRLASGESRPIAEQFLAKHKDVQAIVCYGIGEAMSLLAAAERMGRRVPDDLHLVVFHFKVAHADMAIPIDTMIVPFKQVGLRAVQLLERITDGGSGRRPDAVEVPYDTIYQADVDATRPLSIDE